MFSRSGDNFIHGVNYYLAFIASFVARKARGIFPRTDPHFFLPLASSLVTAG